MTVSERIPFSGLLLPLQEGYTYSYDRRTTTDRFFLFRMTKPGVTLTGSPVTAIGDTETGNKEYWAKWEINQYTVTVKPENGEADITITQDYGIPITAPILTREGYQFNGWDKAFPTTMPAEDLTITAQWRDIAVPTGEIKIAENDWKSFFNTITFDLFFKDTQMVTVTAADNSGEAVKIEYLLSDKAGNETRVTVTVNDGHTYEWQSENGQYWQKCKFCNHETAKKDIPTINISGADKVCRTQDYKFSFTLPEGATGAAYGYEFIGLGGAPLTPTVENGLYSGIIKASTYLATENSFKLIVSAKTADGFAFSLAGRTAR